MFIKSKIGIFTPVVIFYLGIKNIFYERRSKIKRFFRIPIEKKINPHTSYGNFFPRKMRR
jgi:hypothetical protein